MTVLPQLERELRAAHGRRRRHSRWPIGGKSLSGRLGWLVPVAAVLVAIAVVAVFGGLGGGSGRPGRALSTPPGVMEFSAAALSPHQALIPAIERSLGPLQRRLDRFFPNVRVSRAGATVIVRHAAAADRTAILALSAPGRLWFFDWESAALTPSGHTVASQLRTQNPLALQISQGGGTGPGASGPGSTPLYDAVKLASRQTAPASGELPAGAGPQYYLFGRAGSRACAAAAAAVAAGHCLLAGPASSPGQLATELPAGVSAGQGQRLVVPPGTLVVQAAAGVAGSPPAVNGAPARFYVLRGRPALTGSDITGPQASRDTSGMPDVQFGFTVAGARAFQRVTAAEARRGANVSVGGMTLDQHFAVVLDGRLLTVPSIDFRQYPDGIIQSGGTGADISGAFSTATARQLAVMLRYGPLSVDLAPLP